MVVLQAPGRSVYSTYVAGFLTSVGPYDATAITYHPSGMTETVTHAKRLAEVGAGVVDRQSLEPASQMARPERIWSDGATVPGTGADGDWDSGSYAYDGAGNITAMGSQSFTYDKVSRLTFGNVAGYGSESYTYDPYGNLITSGSMSLPTSTSTNHLEPATTGAAYDGAGNLTALGLTPSVYTYTYDRFNQLASVSGPGINRSQATTPDGERLFVRDGTTYLFTLRDLGGNVIRELEYTAAGGWKWRRDNIYRDSLLLASETRGEGIKHYHLDHLGSPRLVTNRTGEQYTLFATSPFGKDPTTSAQSTERMRFTVHERDLGSLTDVLDDIDYMHARSYTPRLGRFTSIDPVRGAPRTPQSWNRFSYCMANPVGRVDPTGMEPIGYDYKAATDQLPKPTDILPLVRTVGDWTDPTKTGSALGYSIAANESQGQIALAALKDSARLASAILTVEAGLQAVRGIAAGVQAARLGTTAMEEPSSTVVTFTERALQKGFTKHGGDFGLAGDWNSSRAAEFSSAINQHVNSQAVVRIPGVYRGASVTHYLDASTGLNVMVSPSGSYVSGWRLSGAQMQGVLASGRLF